MHIATKEFRGVDNILLPTRGTPVAKTTLSNLLPTSVAFVAPRETVVCRELCEPRFIFKILFDRSLPEKMWNRRLRLYNSVKHCLIKMLSSHWFLNVVSNEMYDFKTLDIPTWKSEWLRLFFGLAALFQCCFTPNRWNVHFFNPAVIIYYFSRVLTWCKFFLGFPSVIIIGMLLHTYVRNEQSGQCN